MALLREIAADWKFYRYCELDGSPLTPFGMLGFWVVATYRFGRAARRLRLPVAGQLARLFYRVLKFIVSSLSGVDIRNGAEIGARMHVHTFYGIVIADGVRIGDDCWITTGACIAHRANNAGDGVPVIGNHVRIGMGAKIIGGVTIGDHAIIGANAVVTRDVPAGHVAVGIPAHSRPGPRAYIDDFYSPENPLRRRGILPPGEPPEPIVARTPPANPT